MDVALLLSPIVFGKGSLGLASKAYSQTSKLLSHKYRVNRAATVSRDWTFVEKELIVKIHTLRLRVYVEIG